MRSKEHRELRNALEFYERIVLFKTNGKCDLSRTYPPIIRKPREHFADYVIRVRAAFPVGHKLPRRRLRV